MCPDPSAGPSASPCPHCGQPARLYRNPVPTVDTVIELEDGSIVLILRKNPPLGWALPGGFVDYGETVEQAAVREAAEETGLSVKLGKIVGVYSDPHRDPRQHTISVVFAAKAKGTPVGGDDAGEARAFRPDRLPVQLAFDHRRILDDYFQMKSQRTIR